MKKIRSAAFGILLCITFNVWSQPYLVGHTTITYSDPARSGRNIQTEIYYPSAASGTSVPVVSGSFPVIIFGHGFVMSWDAYQNFWDNLVPQGYIIAFPRTEGNFSPVHSEFGKDLAFLSAKLQSESSNASSLFYNHVSSRSAIMGHSMGGGSAFLAADNNSNITTMISFAAANTSPSSINAATRVTVPALVFSGENDCIAPPVTNQVPMYDSLASGCKAFVNIKGAAHCEFAEYNVNCSFGQSTCSPQPLISGAEQKDVMNDLLDLWLAYYLKDDCAAIGYFNDSLVSSSRISSNQSCTGNTAPVITLAGSVLQSSAASTYQWFYNGSILSGETSQTLNTSLPGTYYVSVTFASACSFISNVINVSAAGISAPSYLEGLIIFPNPAHEKLNFKFPEGGNGVVRLRIVNIIGAVIIEDEHALNKDQNEGLSIDIGDLRPGVYFIEAVSKDSRLTRKLIVE